MQTIVVRQMWIWTAKICLVFCIVATILPFLTAGHWAIRLFDFPRIQLALLTLIPLSLVVLVGAASGWKLDYILTAVGALIIGLWQIGHILPYTPLWPEEVSERSADSDRAIRVLVANLQHDNSSHSDAISTLESVGADVMLLIEVDELWSRNLAPLAESYPNRRESIRDEGLGLVLWSRLPFGKSEIEYLVSERRPSIHAELLLSNGDIVRFCGVHPTPPGLLDETPGGRRSSRVRDAELVQVARKVAEKPNDSWIVTGDFNDVAWSHTTRLFKRLSGLKDPRVGRQLLNTYHADYPLLRYPIDHVFVSDNGYVGSISRLRIPGSDHFAMIADLSFNAQSEEDINQDINQAAKLDDYEEAAELVEEGKNDAAERRVLAH